jgi:hypothetical protein
VLDRRTVLFLARRGAGVDHPTAAANIAALIELAARRPGRRILNAADPDAPSALDMSRAIAAHLGHTWEEILLGREDGPGTEDGEEPPGQATLGRHPWDAPHPIVLDMTAAAALGYTPAGDYATTVAAEVDWLTAAARGGDDADLIPGPADDYFAPLLDYPAEDRWLAARAGTVRGRRRPGQERPDQQQPDQQRSDQQRPDQQRPDQQRPDGRRPDGPLRMR